MKKINSIRFLNDCVISCDFYGSTIFYNVWILLKKIFMKTKKSFNAYNVFSNPNCPNILLKNGGIVSQKTFTFY